jgi:hypothetical protein
MTDELIQSAAVAFILVSDNFLGSHPYLKDSAALIGEPDAPRSKSEERAREGFYDVCQMGTHSQFSSDELLLIWKFSLDT